MNQQASEALAEAPQYNPEVRLYDDTVTWLAEAIDGHMRTPFTYSFDGHELYGQDGSAIGEIFKDALVDAKNLPQELAFEYRRRQLEMDEYNDMITMMRGADFNTIVVVSDFPPELMAATADVGGYNITRKQTMLRVLTKTDVGELYMRSQTLDRSDRAALEAMYRVLGYAPQAGELLGQRMYLSLDSESQEFLSDHLTGIYDQNLKDRLGGNWHAGRPTGHKINTYDFVRSQTDLLGAYLQSAQKFGDNSAFLHDIAAAMQKRYTKSSHHGQAADNPATLSYLADFVSSEHLLREIVTAGQEAIRTGKTFSGCGLSVGNEMLDTEERLNQSGYGNKSQEDEFGPLTFKCKNGHTNKRPRGQLITQCRVSACKNSVSC